MAFADGHAVERALRQFWRGRIWFWFRAKIIFDVLPVVDGLIIRAERAAGVVTAMHHAMLAARIARNAIHDAIFSPLPLQDHSLIAAIMAVGHQVAWRLPA